MRRALGVRGENPCPQQDPGLPTPLPNPHTTCVRESVCVYLGAGCTCAPCQGKKDHDPSLEKEVALYQTGIASSAPGAPTTGP